MSACNCEENFTPTRHPAVVYEYTLWFLQGGKHGAPPCGLLRFDLGYDGFEMIEPWIC